MSNEQGVILCYDLGGTNCEIGAFDSASETILSHRKHKVDAKADGGALLAGLIRTGQELLADIQQPACGIGFASTGIVDTDTGVIVAMNHLAQLEGMPVGQQLAVAFDHVPVVMENDARAYAMGEATFGAGKGFANVLCYTIGTGVGCGFVHDGEPMRSKGLMSPILGGHVTVDVNGPLCSCGNRGCMEVFASAAGIKTMMTDAWMRDVASVIREKCGNNIHKVSPKALFAALAEKDALAIDIFDRFSRAVGAGIVTGLHLLDPDVVVLGGGVVAEDLPVVAAARDYVTRFAWTQPEGRVQIVRAALGDHAALYGVAALLQRKRRCAEVSG